MVALALGENESTSTNAVARKKWRERAKCMISLQDELSVEDEQHLGRSYLSLYSTPRIW